MLFLTLSQIVMQCPLFDCAVW